MGRFSKGRTRSSASTGVRGPWQATRISMRFSQRKEILVVWLTAPMAMWGLCNRGGAITSCASSDAASGWESFTLEEQADGMVAIRTCHGTYIAATKEGDLRASSTEVSGWEAFSVE